LPHEPDLFGLHQGLSVKKCFYEDLEGVPNLLRVSEAPETLLKLRKVRQAIE
jgi:hypothetical protein